MPVTSAPETKSPSLEAERALLGAIILEPEETFLVMQRAGVTADYFRAAPWHRALYGVLMDMREKGRGIDLLTVSDYIKSKGITEDVGGEFYVERLIDACPSAAFAQSYIECLRERYEENIILTACTSARERILHGGEASEAVGILHKAVSALESHKPSNETVDKIANDAEAEWVEARGRGFVGIPSKWKDVNAIIGGYRTGEVFVYGAYRGEGKSMVMSNESLDKAMRGIPTLDLSLEMTRRGLVKRILGDIANFSTFKMDIGKGTDQDFANLAEARKLLAGLPLYIDDSVRTEADIASSIAYHVAAKGVKMVWLDHMQLIRPSRPTGNEVADAKHVSNEMSILAKRFDVALVVLSQFSRNAEFNNERPKLSSLKGTAAIEEDARGVILISRDPSCMDHVPPRYIWEIAKNNNGGTGEVRMVRIGNRQRWREASTYIAGENGDPPAYKASGEQRGTGGFAPAERLLLGIHK